MRMELIATHGWFYATKITTHQMWNWIVHLVQKGTGAWGPRRQKRAGAAAATTVEYVGGENSGAFSALTKPLELVDVTHSLIFSIHIDPTYDC